MADEFLSNARPPAPGVRIGRWTLETSADLRILRALVHQVLREQPVVDEGLRDDMAEKMTIVATELAANAIEHATPPTTVQLFCTDTSFILDVADRHPLVAPRFVADPRPGAGGLGLHMARKLSSDMGWYTVDGSKVVWAQVAIPTAPIRR
jgi:serine/threonine-protein kinase RsbW